MPPRPKQNKSTLLSQEKRRLRVLNLFEHEARSKGYQHIAGIDEAGRGPLAGPVVAAACIISEGIFFPGIDDSKKLSASKREILYSQILEKSIYALAIISPQEIDRINIYQATIQAMMRAVSGLSLIPDYLLVDGMPLLYPSIPSQKIIKGDTKSQSIAAASILAKVTRDRLMAEYDEEWPQYGFKQHKGYGTPQHLAAIEIHGPCPIHRMTFEPLKSLDCMRVIQLNLF